MNHHPTSEHDAEPSVAPPDVHRRWTQGATRGLTSAESRERKTIRFEVRSEGAMAKEPQEIQARAEQSVPASIERSRSRLRSSPLLPAPASRHQPLHTTPRNTQHRCFHDRHHGRPPAGTTRRQRPGVQRPRNARNRSQPPSRQRGSAVRHTPLASCVTSQPFDLQAPGSGYPINL